MTDQQKAALLRAFPTHSVDEYSTSVHTVTFDATDCDTMYHELAGGRPLVIEPYAVKTLTTRITSVRTLRRVRHPQI